jgi:hypothetical protein
MRAMTKSAMICVIRHWHISIAGLFDYSWRYRDDGSDLGINWRATDFNDRSWDEGPAELGFGRGDESTELAFGNDPSQKHITTYFRKEF